MKRKIIRQPEPGRGAPPAPTSAHLLRFCAPLVAPTGSATSPTAQAQRLRLWASCCARFQNSLQSSDQRSLSFQRAFVERLDALKFFLQ